MQNNIPLTVMVVDDHDDVGAILKRWLEDGGYHVIEATSGSEAVEMAQRERPKLILMDLAMPPETDGFAATLQIRAHEDLRDVPIIGISAYGELGIDAQLKVDPRAAGFNAYLSKPFVFDKLLDVVRQYIAES